MRLIGLDIGERRIGVAVSDPGGLTAQPLTVIYRDSDEKAIAEIIKIIGEYDAEGVIYGMPLEEDGDRGHQAMETEEFAEKIKKSSGVQVMGHDERYSTTEAERVLIEQDVSRRRRRDLVDKIAASIILQGYLDKRHG